MVQTYDQPEQKLPVYIGSELYSPRMYPEGCPSFGKLQIKLFKVVEDAGKSSKKLELLDSLFISNREAGFEYITRDLAKGNYQI